MPLFFAPRLWANSDSVSHVLNRFESYAQALQQLNNNEKKLTFLGITGEVTGVKNYSEYGHLNVKLFKKNILGRIMLVVFLFKSIRKEKVAISGDPYLSFWFLWLIKKFFVRKIQIQISIHGVPMSSNKTKSRHLRLFGLRNACRRADNIRVVSQHLSDLLQNDWGVSQNRIFVAPIPVQITSIDHKSNKRKQIVIVGRMHEERGVLLSLDIALKVLAKNPDVALLLIGDGPLRSKVESIVNQSGFRARISILGKLPHSEVLKKLSESHVLLSSAPEEGFGLAIREAAYSGLFVVALRNSGTIEAERELAPILNVFSTASEAVSMCELSLRSQLSPSVVDRVIGIRKALNEESLRSIALSWL